MCFLAYIYTYVYLSVFRPFFMWFYKLSLGTTPPPSPKDVRKIKGIKGYKDVTFSYQKY